MVVLDSPIKLEDIARQAGVSVATVSRALNGGAVNPDTRRRILQLADEAQYQAPPRRGRTADRGSTSSLAIVLAPPAAASAGRIDAFSLGIIGGVARALGDRGQPLTIHPVLPDGQAALTRLLESPVGAAGYIFLGQSHLHTALNRLAGKTPFVVWGAALDDQAYCCVGSDNLRGGQRAAEHLIRLGRRRIVFLGEIGTFEFAQRHAGYRTALEQAGLPVEDRLHRPCPLTPDAAAEAIDDLIDAGLPFDGVVAASDLAALGALRALERRGRLVPADVAVVGYDDVEIASHIRPSLTTIRQDPVKAGRLLVSKLARQLDGQDASSERLPTELIVRESCGA